MNGEDSSDLILAKKVLVKKEGVCEDRIVERLRLWSHTAEVMEIALKLFEFYPNGTFSDEDKKVVLMAALTHDFGKINPYFQEYMWKDCKEKIEELINSWKEAYAGIESVTVDHEILSTLWTIILFLGEKGFDKAASLVLLHHLNNFYDIFSMEFNELLRMYLSHVKNYLLFLKYANEDEGFASVTQILKSILEKVKEKLNQNELAVEVVEHALDAINDRDKFIKRIECLLNSFSSYFSFIPDIYNPYKDGNGWGMFFILLGILHTADHWASDPHISLDSIRELGNQLIEEAVKQFEESLNS